MYLEIDEGFPGHRKTLRLCSLMKNPEAGWYMIRLWTWACRSCPTGNLVGFTAYDVEMACQYRKLDGACFSAMVSAGFVDTDESGPTAIHGWMEHTGGAIKRMEGAAASKKSWRLHKDGKCGKSGLSCEWCAKDASTSKDSPRTVQGQSLDKTAQDKTSQDKTSQDKSISLKGGEAPPRKIRPSTAHNLEHCMRVAIEREQPQAGFWIPGRFSTSDADKMIRDLGDIEAALPVIERKIDLFAKDPSMQPWTMAKFVDKWNEIGLAKLEYGQAPKATLKPRCTPVISR